MERTVIGKVFSIWPRTVAAYRQRSGDASRPPNGAAVGARISGREARSKPALHRTAGCSAPTSELRGRRATAV